MKIASQLPRIIALGALAVILVFLLTGCTTMETAALPLQPGESLHAGDKVHVHMKAGPTLTFQVATIEPGALTGTDGTRVLLADISELKAQRISGLRTGGAALGAIGGAILILLLLAAAHGA